MSEIRFYKVFLFFLSVFVFFLFLSIVNVPETYKIKNLEIRNPDILRGIKHKITPLQLINKKDIEKVFLKNFFKIDTSNKNVKFCLEYPENNFDALKNFFSSLLHSKGKIHILHYGDSQIEGDRITAIIRDTLQKIFGGQGCGLIFPVKINNVQQYVNVVPSKEWKRYTFKDFNYKNCPFLGVMLNIFKFNDINISCEKIDFNIVNLMFFNTIGNKLRILYSNKCNKEIVQLFSGKKIIGISSLEVSDETISICEFSISNSNYNSLTLEFSGKGDPTIYGISFDSDNGVIVSNIGIRGSAGLDFTRLNKKLMSRIFDLLSVKLIIYQFGINVVPSMSEKKLRDYEIALTAQLKYFKSINSNIDVIVIGVTDMSRKIDGVYVSYPLIEKINEAQKRAAFKANCAFWDAFKKMGGKNSMSKWATYKPPLASKDYAHLTNEGCKIISTKFIEDLLKDFESYKRSIANISNR
ncbi:MAG: hypothetical protein N3A01_03155 [Bacteroidales bacterium]|nr:hypothetical protein [Bacteroidales bacterium]